MHLRLGVHPSSSVYPFQSLEMFYSDHFYFSSSYSYSFCTDKRKDFIKQKLGVILLREEKQHQITKDKIERYKRKYNTRSNPGGYKIQKLTTYSRHFQNSHRKSLLFLFFHIAQGKAFKHNHQSFPAGWRIGKLLQQEMRSVLEVAATKLTLAMRPVLTFIFIR